MRVEIHIYKIKQALELSSHSSRIIHLLCPQFHILCAIIEWDGKSNSIARRFSIIVRIQLEMTSISIINFDSPSVMSHHCRQADDTTASSAYCMHGASQATNDVIKFNSG